MRKAKVKRRHKRECNKHHPLYPERAYLLLGKLGTTLRDGFVIWMPMDLHRQLHDKVDRTLGGYVYRKMLPSEKTLRYLNREFEKNERAIKKMKPIDKIKWLEDRLSYKDARSYWLKNMLREQREFLEKHSGEL